MFDYGAGQYPNWTALSPDSFEQLVKQMLLREHPDGHGFDGRGGDGGRDFIVETPTSELIYQVKALAPRLGDPQKKQIKASFEKVADRPKLTKWVLVLPFEFSPAERTWFNNTFANQRFVTACYDENWLRNTIAKYHDIRFAMLEAGSAQAVVRNNLDAIGNSIVKVEDLLEPATRLGRVGEMVSTKRNFVPIVSPGGPPGLTITRKDGLPERLKIAALSGFVEPAALDDLQWGRSTTFECSADLLALAFDDEELAAIIGIPGASTLVKADAQVGPALSMSLETLDEHGSIVKRTQLRSAPATRGPSGIELCTTDRSGWLHVRFRFDPTGGWLDMSYEPLAPSYPEDILDGLRFVRDSGDGRLRVRVTNEEGGTFASESFELPKMWEGQEPVVEYVEDVLFLQRYAGVHHRISLDVAFEDYANVRSDAKMLRGETATANVRYEFVPERMHPWILDPDGVSLGVDVDIEAIAVQDVEYPIGRHRLRLHCDKAVVQNVEELRRAQERGEKWSAIAVAKAGHTWTTTLGRYSDGDSKA